MQYFNHIASAFGLVFLVGGGYLLWSWQQHRKKLNAIVREQEDSGT